MLRSIGVERSEARRLADLYIEPLPRMVMFRTA